jgi:hypothetical protein
MSAARRWTLWGWTARFRLDPEIPIRITTGSLRDCNTRERQFRQDYPDALTGVYEFGDKPVGLSIQVQQRIAET